MAIGPLGRAKTELVGAGLTSAKIFDIGEEIAAGVEISGGESAQKLAILGSLTTDFIARAVACGVAQEDVRPWIYQGPFGGMVQEIVDPASGLYDFRPDIVLLCVDWRDLVSPLPVDAPEDAVHAAIEQKVDTFEQLWAALSERSGARLIQHLPPPPTERFRGVSERLAPASALNQVLLANRRLIEAGQGRVTWIELDRLAASLGAARWCSPRMFHSAKLPFDQRFLPEYLMAFRGAWRAACGRAKKVLALDLDNTLWGGVVGDDGVAGLQLGPGSAAGEAYVEWQAYVRGLAERGVILSVVSKNDPGIAAEGLAHPSSLFKPADFAGFECSWGDKAGGLRRVAERLNLDLASIVFVDDNPAECALVRAEAPEVSVVELGADPTQFIARLDAGCWFDLDRLTTEDVGRSAAYVARAQGLQATDTVIDLASHLGGLSMVGRVSPATQPDLARLAQMEQKTNQFNLTTRRYREADLAAFIPRPDAVVLALWLKDRFGDHGLVASLVAVESERALRIDSWLMSCRVFSRSAEQLMLRELIGIARTRRLDRIIGQYLPTAKNGVVAELFSRLGFTKIDGSLWSRETDAPMNDLETHIELAPNG
ncbi:HAD family hydrolase [Caulobacter sp. S45]|uniref:HAD-IIIC family phosphatase n=1 Tax=Caulobacter sp. S45 TaxID=1641861 RepID=UPI001575B1D6|nr:HAD-IIIC family phosphatase [Caulobacter sp. S45]